MSNSKRIKRPVKPTSLLNPGAFILRIEHDDWCGYWQSKQGDDCNCNPNVRTIRPFDNTTRQN